MSSESSDITDIISTFIHAFNTCYNIGLNYIGGSKSYFIQVVILLSTNHWKICSVHFEINSLLAKFFKNSIPPINLV